jgi:hypothetical protein
MAKSGDGSPAPERLHALDAVRGFALLLGIVLHATMSFVPTSHRFWIIQENFPGEPEPTRGTSRTRTRDQDSPLNDDLVDIQFLQHLGNDAPQSGNPEFVRPDILAADVKSAQGGAPSLQRNLRHCHDRSGGRRYSRGDNRSLAVIGDDIDRHGSAPYMYASCVVNSSKLDRRHELRKIV